MFYNFDQNNSGGSFITDDKVCHQLYIEANSEEEAVNKAEQIGCYWNGVEDGIDCPCCGDRWSTYTDAIDLDKYREKGYQVEVYSHYQNAEKRWNDLYGHLMLIEPPIWKETYGVKEYAGKVAFNDIEEYAQFISDNYGWTTPDARIFYLDGSIKEIFSRKFN